MSFSKHSILFLICIANFLLLNAQTFQLPFTGELDLKLEKSEEEKLLKAVAGIEEAKVVLSQTKGAYDILDPEEKKEGGKSISKTLKELYKQLKNAADNFDDSYTEIYDIYKDKCNKFWETQRDLNHYATGLEKAKYYERVATRALGRAQTDRGQAEIAKKFEDAYLDNVNANNYLLIAIRSQGRALQIYQDYPVEYDYGWENDIDIDKILAERSGPIVEEAQVDTTMYALADTLNPAPDTRIVYVHDTIFIILKDSLNFQDTTITFRVQIAAHTIPLSKSYLRTIYQGNREIFELKEEEWYKYSIGIFKDYYEARRIMEESGVERAFIVPYVAGRKISIREALERLGINPNK